MRRCRRNVAVAGAAADVRQGLCTRSDDKGAYEFTRLMRTGRYFLYAPKNNVDDATSSTALDHDVKSVSVSTVVGAITRQDIALVRFPAIRGTARIPDPANPTNFLAATGFTVTVTFCQPGATPNSCVIPATDSRYQEPKGRVSYGGDGTYRVDRLTPLGVDPITGIQVSAYVITFRLAGYADQSPFVTAPALNEERQVDVVMLQAPTRVEITPFWLLANGTEGPPRPDTKVTVNGIVDYNTKPEAVSGTAQGGLVGGKFDSGTVTFKAGSIDVTVTAAGFPAATGSTSLDGTSSTGLSNVTVVDDPTVPGHKVLRARLELLPDPRTVSGAFGVTCCVAPDPVGLAITNPTMVFASVQAVLRATGVERTGPLDTNGNYKISNVPPGTYQLTFEVYGDDPHNLAPTGQPPNITMPSPLTVIVQPNLDTTVPGRSTGQLHAARIHGRILDVANGNKPLVGATISVPDLRDVGLVKSPTDITDNDGIYDLTIYDVPRDLKLSVFKDDGRPTSTIGPFTFDPGGLLDRTTPGDGVAGPKGVIQGQVLGQANPSTAPQPLDGVRVTLNDNGAPIGSPATSVTGNYTFTDVVVGPDHTYTLTFEKDGYDRRTGIAVTALPNQTTAPFGNPIILAATARPVTVHVVSAATDAGGAHVPLVGVNVNAVLTATPTLPNPPISGSTVAGGTAVLNLPPGDWTLRTTNGAIAATADLPAAPHRDGSITFTVGVGTTALDAGTIQLAGPFATASGTVVGRDNPTAATRVLAGVTVTLTTAQGAVTAITESNGTFTFPANIPVALAAATDYTVAVSNVVGYTDDASGTLSLLLGQPTTVPQIELSATPQPARFVVTAVESGQPLAGVTISASLVGSSAAITAVTVADGSATVNLQPGSWNYTTSNAATATSGTPPALNPHGDVTGTLPVSFNSPPATTALGLNPLVTVAGRIQGVPGGDVLGMPNIPVAAANLVFTRIDVANPPEPFPSRSTPSGGDGSYSILLTPGRYRLEATAVGFNPFVETVEVPVAGLPAHNFLMQGLPMALQGTVTTNQGTPLANISVRFSTVVGTAPFTATVRTDRFGGYSYRLAAGVEWTVAFDPSTSADPLTQDVPVLYRYVGPTNGGVSVTLNHTLFANVMALQVTAKGVLPGCATSCVTHDVATPVALTLTDNGTPVDGRTRTVQFDPATTASVGGVQVGTITNVPAELTNLQLVGKSAGYADASIPVNMSTLPNCAGSTTTRCVELDLTALARSAAVTVTDAAGAPVTGATVRFQTGTPATTVSSCTLSGGTCTTAPPMTPLFGTYGSYAVVVDATTTTGQLITTAEVPPGAGNVPVAIPGVPVLPRVTVQPAPQTVVVDAPATFSATITGSRPLAVQWETSPDGATWTPVGDAQRIDSGSPGDATVVTYTTPAAALTDDGRQFRVTATNGGANGAIPGLVQSSGARLTVTPPPTTQPPTTPAPIAVAPAPPEPAIPGGALPAPPQETTTTAAPSTTAAPTTTEAPTTTTTEAPPTTEATTTTVTPP